MWRAVVRMLPVVPLGIMREALLPLLVRVKVGLLRLLLVVVMVGVEVKVVAMGITCRRMQR